MLHHITPGWLRFDVTLTTLEHLVRRASNLVRAVFDLDGLEARLAPPAEPLLPDADAVQRLVTEFFRVMGLFAVVAGRGEALVGASGCALLRSLLISLMLQDVAVPDRGGVLHLERLLPADRAQILRELPPVRADLAHVRAFHVACAQVFLPLARDLAKRTGCAWPNDFEDATRKHLARETGLTLPG